MNSEIRNLIELGKTQFDRGNYSQAEKLFEKALGQNPAFADVNCLLGIIKHDRGEFAKAISLFRKSLEINPDYAEARLNLMITFNDLGKYEEAKSLVKRIKDNARDEDDKRDPITLNKIANAHACTAELYLSMGDYIRATEELEKALQIRPNFADIRARLGLAYREAGRNNDSVIQLVEALKINPNYIYARIQLGISYLEVGQKDEAIRQWDLVLSVDQGNLLAKTYKQLANSE